jgi:hypothetical protein
MISLGEFALSDMHYDGRLEPVDLIRLIAWVDAHCPFLEMRRSGPWRIASSRVSSELQAGPA